jgi:DNA-binding CsgD family transcriptional regulator
MVQRETGRQEAAGILTPREIEIVKHVADGLHNLEIAKQLFISEGTVGQDTSAQHLPEARFG